MAEPQFEAAAREHGLAHALLKGVSMFSLAVIVALLCLSVGGWMDSGAEKERLIWDREREEWGLLFLAPAILAMAAFPFWWYFLRKHLSLPRNLRCPICGGMARLEPREGSGFDFFCPACGRWANTHVSLNTTVGG